MIYPRTSAFLKVKYFRQICKFSTSPAGVIEQLKNRKLIQVSGSGVSDFLQGLITNDMKHLENSFGSMYTMFLNVRGRVLYDTIIYRTSEQNVYLIECDSDVVNSLQKHLKMYRVRRKIDITNLEKDLNIWVNFYPNINENDINIKRSVKNLEGQTVPCSLLNETDPKTSVEISNVIDNNTLLVYHDPRLSELGSRIITSSEFSLETLKTKLSLFDHLEPSESSNYKLFRYRLGIAEGIVELPPGSCLPLECNCDYLHGVSFHKGCYIGQELTARSYHTGVIRKRLMPIIFNSEFDKKPNHDEIVRSTDDPKSKIGKLKGVEKNLGIGILRIAQALQAKALKIGEVDGITTKPYWWPIEAPKDIASIQKSAN